MKSMKLCLGILIIPLNVLLLVSFPYGYLIKSVDYHYLLLFILGTTTYMLLHILRKTEGYYIWNHELSHLVIAKVFMKKIKGFHITSGKGGRVVVSESNWLIDLAPYYFSPILLTILLLSLIIIRGKIPYAERSYFFLFGFHMTLMLAFTGDSLMKGQEDLKKNGYLFSLSVIFFLHLITTSIFLIPAVGNKMGFLKALYFGWFSNLDGVSRLLFEILIK